MADMSVCKVSITQKYFLLSVILTMGFFLAVMGMRPPQLSKVNKPRIHARDIVQNPEKITLAGVDQTILAFEECQRTEFAKTPTYNVTVFPVEELSSNATLTPLVDPLVKTIMLLV